MSDKATLSEIRDAYVRPQGLFGHYGMETRARDFDAAIDEVERAAAARAWDEGLTAGLREANDLARGVVNNPALNPYLRARAEAYRQERGER